MKVLGVSLMTEVESSEGEKGGKLALLAIASDMEKR